MVMSRQAAACPGRFRAQGAAQRPRRELALPLGRARHFFFVYRRGHAEQQLVPQKLSAWRKNHPGAPGAARRVARRSEEASREKKNPAAAGIERFFSLKGPRRERS